MKIITNTKLKISILFILFSALNIQAQNFDHEIRQALQLVEYVGVDYSSAVKDSQVVDEGEYQEMVEFAGIVSEKLAQISKVDDSIALLANTLQDEVKNKAEVSTVKSLAVKLKTQLSQLTDELVLPEELLETQLVSTLFKENCASCHGETGAGDGIKGKNLTPSPTNFQDQQRADNRSVFGLYQAITEGLDGTAMVSYKHFSDDQRWSLAFKVAGMAYQNGVSDSKSKQGSSITLQNFVMFSPNELSAKSNEIELSDIAAMRAKPTDFYFSSGSFLQITKQQLLKAQSAYENNDLKQAKILAVSAYLDGFELIEKSLDAHDKSLRKAIEVKLMGLRKQLSLEDNSQQVQQSITESLQMLNQAESLLSEASLSNTTIFTASFIILLREGLEALLVVLALFTILVRSGHKTGRKYLHIGWVSALFAGFLTWVAAEYLIEISGASREIMEGVAALLAAIILLFVGFWMHSKSNADQWQAYIKNNINKKLKAGSLWGIAGLAFITVYREVFETVLFYQSLILQTQASQQFSLLSGFLFGIFILALVAWLVIKYSVKMPLGKFFSTTSYLLLILAFILAGKAIAALQEAAVISVNTFPINISFDWLGIYPTWQGLAAQLLVLILSIALLLRKHK